MRFVFNQYDSMGCGLVGYPQDLLIGKEASVYLCEVEVVITKGILGEIAPLEGIDGAVFKVFIFLTAVL